MNPHVFRQYDIRGHAERDFDDGFVRAHFQPGEIRGIREVRSLVRAPRSLRDLVRIKTRSRLGAMELAARFPDLWGGKSSAARGLRSKLAGLSPRLE